MKTYHNYSFNFEKKFKNAGEKIRICIYLHSCGADRMMDEAKYTALLFS